MAPSTRLHLRFAAATAAVIATAGGALLWFVQRQEVARAEHNVTVHTQFVEKSVLRQELRPNDITARWPGRGSASWTRFSPTAS